MKTKQTKQDGVTLIELLLVCAIVGVIAFEIRCLCQQYELKEQRAVAAQATNSVALEVAVPPEEPVPFGENVYYFHDTNGVAHACSLAVFLHKHPDLEPATDASDVQRLNRVRAEYSQYDYGSTVGYTTTFRVKPKP